MNAVLVRRKELLTPLARHASDAGNLQESVNSLVVLFVARIQMRRLPRLCVALLLGVILQIVPGLARATEPPNFVRLKTWNAAQVLTLTPLLRSGDVSVIESNAGGELQQITTFSLVAASPEIVRSALLAREPLDGNDSQTKDAASPVIPLSSFERDFAIDLGLLFRKGRNRYELLPADSESVAAPVQVCEIVTNQESGSYQRWEFYGAAGATLVVLSGYTPVLRSQGVFGLLAERIAQLEHGVALVVQQAILQSVKQRAEAAMGAPPLMPAAGSADYSFLLARGVVVALRTQAGHVIESSLSAQIAAAPDVVGALIKEPSRWSQFMPNIARSVEMASDTDLQAVELTQVIPLLRLQTFFGLRSFGDSLDMLGKKGDLRGARLRFDLQSGPAASSVLVLRSQLPLAKRSTLLRYVLKAEPLLEPALHLGFLLPMLRGLQLEAEKLAVTK
jgi:hypothetical protein